MSGIDAKGWVSVCAGDVVAVKTWSDTHVTSSGGGGYVGQNGGRVRAAQVRSDVVQRQEIYVRDSQGKEEVIDFSKVRFREGSKGLFVWAGPLGGKAPLIYAENIDTGETYSAIAQPFGLDPWFGWLTLFVIVWGLVLSALIGVISSTSLWQNMGNITALFMFGIPIVGLYLSMRWTNRYMRSEIEKNRFLRSDYVRLLGEKGLRFEGEEFNANGYFTIRRAPGPVAGFKGN